MAMLSAAPEDFRDIKQNSSFQENDMLQQQYEDELDIYNTPLKRSSCPPSNPVNGKATNPKLPTPLGHGFWKSWICCRFSLSDFSQKRWRIVRRWSHQLLELEHTRAFHHETISRLRKHMLNIYWSSFQFYFERVILWPLSLSLCSASEAHDDQNPIAHLESFGFSSQCTASNLIAFLIGSS